MLATEILGSVLMAEVRCASAPAVVHAPPPRPCAWAVPAATSTPRNIPLLRRHTTFINWKLLRDRRRPNPNPITRTDPRPYCRDGTRSAKPLSWKFEVREHVR